MNWQALKAALRTMAANASGLAETKIEWRDGKRTMMQHPYLTLRILASSHLGQDQVTYEFDGSLSPDPDVVPTVSGQRIFTLSIEARSRENSDGLEAMAILECLRSSLRKPSIVAALNAAKLSIVRHEGLVDASTPADERVESRAVLDVVLSTVSTSGDTPITSIDSFSIASGEGSGAVLPETVIPQE